MMDRTQILEYYSSIGAIVATAWTLPVSGLTALVAHMENRQARLEQARCLAPGATPRATADYLRLARVVLEFRRQLDVMVRELDPGSDLACLLESLAIPDAGEEDMSARRRIQ